MPTHFSAFGNGKAAALAIIVSAILISGCSQKARYEVLTIFFTGVPPYEEWAGISKPDEAGVETETPALASARERVREQRRQRLIAQAKKLPWVHGPYAARECDKCHSLAGSASFRFGGGRKGTGPAGVGTRLAVPVTELCLGCHAEKSAEAAGERGLRVHGPVASGLCVACHSPHQSRQRYFLRARDRTSICTSCHGPDGMDRESFAHRGEAGTLCLTCHNPHMGRTALMLRSDYDEAAAY